MARVHLPDVAQVVGSVEYVVTGSARVVDADSGSVVSVYSARTGGTTVSTGVTPVTDGKATYPWVDAGATLAIYVTPRGQGEQGPFYFEASTGAGGSGGGSTTQLTVTDIAEPWVLPHRNGGSNLNEEEALESFDFAAGFGFRIIDGGDVWQISDGPLVPIHDTTTGRTMTGTSATVTAETLATWQARQIKGIVAARPNLPAPLFYQLLERQKRYKVVTTPEAKHSAAVKPMTDLIVSYGLQNSVILAVSATADAAYPKSFGIKVAFVAGSTSVSAASIASAGFDYYWYDAKGSWATDSWLQGIKVASPSIKFLAYSDALARRAAFTAEKTRMSSLSLALAGIASNDPLWTTGVSPSGAATDAYALKMPSSGLLPSLLSVRPTFTSSRLLFADTTSQWAYQGRMSRDATPASITFTVTFDALDADATRWVGIGFGCPDDRDWHDHQPATNSGQGYGAFLRQSGNFGMFRHDADGTTATQIVTAVSTTAATAGQSVQIKVEFLASNVIKATRVDTATSIQATDATYRGGHFHFGKNLAPGGGTNGAGQYSFSAVTVVP